MNELVRKKSYINASSNEIIDEYYFFFQPISYIMFIYVANVGKYVMFRKEKRRKNVVKLKIEESIVFR